MYLFRNYRRFRSPVVFAEKFTLKPHWDEGYCYLEDSRGNKFVLVTDKGEAPEVPGAVEVKVPVKRIVTVFYSPVISTLKPLRRGGSTRDPIGYMEDYARMIHPELFPDGDNNLKYYVKLK